MPKATLPLWELNSASESHNKRTLMMNSQTTK